MPTLLGALGNEPTTDDTVINMGPSEQALALIQNDNILEDRANTMQSIEASMLEVQDIMKDMVHVISIQGETVETLHDNVEQTVNTFLLFVIYTMMNLFCALGRDSEQRQKDP